MNKQLILAAALLTGVAGAAFAQTGTTTQTTTTTTKETTTLQPAWRTEMKEYVVKEHRAPVTPPAGFRVSVGEPLPPAVEVYPFPTTAPYGKYRYSVIGNETVVVDPADRRIVEVIR
ncbi:MAG TPA: DUF1236 domain-containing protein [Stellaceae bacterium]|jgi:hypothetical protein|nr:DUF1236 domain-containing protein [Stellaceae bacterium]